METKPLVLNKLLIFFFIFGLTTALRKLTEEENEDRLSNCGKPPDATSPYYNFRNHSWWIGHVYDTSLTDYAVSRYGAVLISPYHAILTSAVLKDGRFNAGSTCRDNEVEHLYAPENATIYFWLDEAGPKTPFKVANWSFYGDCRTPREENSFVMAEFEQKIPVPYACFPEYDSFYSARKLPMAIIPYRVVEPNQDPIFTQYSNGIFDECVDQRFSKWCWRGFKYNYVGHLDDIGYSRPLITSNYDRPTIVGFAWGHYLDRIREFFSLTPIRDYSSVLCEEFGICRGPGTTTVPTTLPPTTVYVPELIADFETMDFESDYNVTRKERTRSSARYSGFFLISIVLGLIQ